ncbi:50S ribosomal protein L9 [Demequina sp. SYSU T00039]|uniref:Large ribosomal subunit protein bL9 n=1 Tax=Demequina lignilytica TaxID=3051663 RepID=A0AAW7M0F1_9MICO|nr:MULTISPECIES: 50S ribosomal protein L9 [unclassified Demequina]MDN4477844.1 50S ribosomal protein L9 [Demequina sp. SYSU T00039-1]MDN4487753.1 50S ribosomal protein L9 [Demequina sp. SYSU T00039]MDN4490864.1 50S ribosomal protein L9 [Demequina sp. SYSU T00068]
MAKVILTHEVSGLGIAGDVVDVKDGYARNYLVPRKLATPWSAGAEKQIEGLRKAQRAKEIASIEGAQAARDALQASPVVVSVKAGESGRLFGAVSPADIADAIGDRAKVDKRRIHVAQPIKALGEYEVKVSLHSDVAAKVTVQVVAAK